MVQSDLAGHFHIHYPKGCSHMFTTLTRKYRSFLTAHLAGLLLLALTLGGRADAAELLETHVPAGYDLTCYLNVRQMMDTPSLEPLRGLIINEPARTFIQNVQQMTGIDLFKDLNEFVMAGMLDPRARATGLSCCGGGWRRKRC